jgi:HD-GYP domain-containing protein (c-di-GMP phosphodiesterase class II)
MGLSENIIEAVHIASLVHDIGKINVPQEILSKPGILSDLEMRIIQIHPQAGYSILFEIDFPWPIAEIVRQHHEHVDGSGYPQGLKADEIVIEARIICVADVIEAMSSHRPYRAVLGLREAVKEITENKDILYDADVVSACKKVIYERGFSFD